jgi:hypothetical protein
MIALENPEFFLKWDVLVVNSLEAALSLASGNDRPEGLEEASGLFQEVRTLAKTMGAGPLCVHPKVRSRLQDDILPKAPYHFSASMLLLQGNLERPTRVEREVAARILRSAVDPLTSLCKAPLANLTPARIDAAFNAARANIDPFSRYFRTEDDDLKKEALDLINQVLAFARAVEARPPAAGGNSGPGSGDPLAARQQQLHAKLTAVLENLAPFTGETLPPKPPADPKAP